MTTQPDALPACVHGDDSPRLTKYRDSFQIIGRLCRCCVEAPTEDAARAAWSALCAPHALAASRAECERLRVALEEIIKAWDHKTGDYYVDNYLSDVEIDAARAAAPGKEA